MQESADQRSRSIVLAIDNCKAFGVRRGSMEKFLVVEKKGRKFGMQIVCVRVDDEFQHCFVGKGIFVCVR